LSGLEAVKMLHDRDKNERKVYRIIVTAALPSRRFYPFKPCYLRSTHQKNYFFLKKHRNIAAEFCW